MFQPVLAWVVSRLCNDFNSIAILKLIFQGNDITVDFGPDTLIAYVRVNAVSVSSGVAPLGKDLTSPLGVKT